jgi:hypothetical protein
MHNATIAQNLTSARIISAPGRTCMPLKFKVGDSVTWNSEAGKVSGTIIKVHTRDVNYKGHMHRATREEPQYEIKSNKTDHIAIHKGAALTRESLE